MSARPSSASPLPRIVVPADFDERYTESERALVLEHERAHIRAWDVQINAMVAFLQCLNWFNPLFHYARALFRVDQELACDERVMQRNANARRTYAEAMLKTQLAARAVPLGCYWPPLGANALKQRIAMLARPKPAPQKRAMGAALCAATVLAAGLAAWAAQPPQLAYAQPRGGASATLGRALVEAIRADRDDEARELIASGADVNYFVRGDGTPLVAAAQTEDVALATLLLETGADVNMRAPGDGNPLIVASAQGNMDLVALFVARGADVNGIVTGDETPLINASRNNAMAAARYLIDRGADVNLAVDAPTIRGVERRSPLSEATKHGHSDMVRMLREAGARS